ncbi:MAG TPA: hypothetical protein VES62_07300 [Thermoleophilaceae bacterium]|nr:hypothetical protein [Thermoleophilaceae bacterium]
MTEQSKRPSRWLSVDQHVQALADETWSTYWAEMTAAESVEFLRNPKGVLVDEGLIDRDFRVQAHVVNADVEAVAGPVCQLLLVFPNEKLALITIYKHPPSD